MDKKSNHRVAQNFRNGHQICVVHAFAVQKMPHVVLFGADLDLQIHFKVFFCYPRFLSPVSTPDVTIVSAAQRHVNTSLMELRPRESETEEQCDDFCQKCIFPPHFPSPRSPPSDPHNMTPSIPRCCPWSCQCATEGNRSRKILAEQGGTKCDDGDVERCESLYNW